MSGHTPGPWAWLFDRNEGHIVRIGDAIRSPYSYDSHNQWVCDHCIDEDDETDEIRAQFAQSEANARLIAAAPELLEYVESSASNGCATAAVLVAKVRGEP